MVNWIKNILRLPLPKIVIGFCVTGCMANIKEFRYIGYVKSTYKSKGGETYYKIQPLVKGSTENRDVLLEEETAWQLQHLGANLYIFYDA